MPIGFDPRSDTWAAVSAEAERIIENATKVATQRGTSPLDTEFARGEIAAARLILNLAAPRKGPEIQPEPGYHE